MHPLAIMGIIAGGLIVCWGGYEAIHTLYEWHNDRKEEREYEEYVRMHAEKGRFSGVPMYTDHDDTDNEEDNDNEPLGIWKQKRDSINSQNELRHRNISLSSQNEKSMQSSTSSYEFYEMEKSISERKNFLERESQVLQKEEAELERRRSILQSRGNSITGVFNDDSDNEQQNPFADSFIDQQQRNNSQHNSFVGSIFDQDHQENPFADSFIEEQPKDNDVNSNKSFDRSNNEGQVVSQQPKEDQYQLLHQPTGHSTSDLEGSWSDLNEDIVEESSDKRNHYRTDSDESFQHIEKH